MHDLFKFSLTDMSVCGAALRQCTTGAGSMEDVAARAVRHLYHHLVDKRSGERACALVRFFKTHDYGELPPGLRTEVQRLVPDGPVPEKMKCLTLLASAGAKREWNRRELSVGHQVIPLASVEVVVRFPMIAHLVSQLGLDLGVVLQPQAELLLECEQKTYNVFHVEEAAGSSHVPAQAEFVVPYGVRSVLGFGGLLPSGNLFAVILFSRVHISKETAERFKPLALSLKVAVLPFDEGVVFAEETAKLR
ncbi:MAG: hypothetical protein HY721_27330 [Planctomycetes bacterium]|nr:hypothetical protein [Planctomycetota bacterium]